MTTTDTSIGTWCRACGRSVSGQGEVCAHCAFPLRPPGAADSPVGLVFEQRRKLLGTKRAICLVDESGQLVLHTSAKETLPADPDVLSEPSDTVPAGLSPAGRLTFALKQPAGPIKADWDPERIRRSIAAVTEQDVAAQRQLADEALAMDWDDILDTLPLTASEKLWLRAGKSARVSDIDGLFQYLSQLPVTGYPLRVSLLLPSLVSVLSQAHRWRPLVESWAAADCPDANEMLALLSADVQAALAAGIAMLSAARAQANGSNRIDDSYDSPNRVDAWRNAADQLQAGVPGKPLVANSPAWNAAHVLGQGENGVNVDLDFGAIAQVPIPLIDNLIDKGTLTRGADLRFAPTPSQPYLRARLAPETLSGDDLAELEHVAEYARRLFKIRDWPGLQSLPATPTVRHYRALLDFAGGRSPELSDLTEQARALVGLALRSKEALEELDEATLADALLRDPSLWHLYGDAVQAGKIQLDAEDREQHPEFAAWCQVHLVLNHIWQAQWQEAIAAVRAVVPALEGHLRAEALSLGAFALAQLGAQNDAVAATDEASHVSSATGLQVNSAIMGSLISSQAGLARLARLCAPQMDPALARALVTRAAEIKNTSEGDEPLPDALVKTLMLVLGQDCPMDEYLPLLRLAARVAPDELRKMPPPSGEQLGPFQLELADLRLAAEAKYTLSDLAGDHISVYRRWGRTPWFDSSWSKLVEAMGNGITSLDFGGGTGYAMFFDTVNVQATELLTRFERIAYLPQAGAHLAGSFADSQETLNPNAFNKFFFVPFDEFMANLAEFGDSQRGALTENICRTMGYVALCHTDVARQQLAAEYNGYVERLRRDFDNRYQLLNAMRQNLNDSDTTVNFVMRLLDCQNRLSVTPEQRGLWIDPVSASLNNWRRETQDLRSRL